MMQPNLNQNRPIWQFVTAQDHIASTTFAHRDGSELD
jgi:hypothetical protein